MAAITRTTQDKGFELLRTWTREADTALGSQEAEKKVIEIIRREAIMPQPGNSQHAMDWTAIAISAARYGVLGLEVVRGAKMMDDWGNHDWSDFGQSYVRYFETALARSSYPLNNLSYQVFEHVTDRHGLETAKRGGASTPIRRADSVFGRYDPTELDMYANLLYMVARRTEGTAWERKARGRERWA